MAIFTICSNNYVPAARILLESAGLHHPEADLFLCLADKANEIQDATDPTWHVVQAEDLSIPDFKNFAFRYDIMEFNTALKPFMFRFLFEERDYDAVLYFDPDIQIFRPLSDVVARLRSGASFVLTPHLCAPNESAYEPNDMTIMRAGVYNLGFLGVAKGNESRTIIDWWARRLRFLCISAPQQGIFVDQKFIDLVPGFAPHAFICHDTSLNVAYWNLRQRALGRDEAGWTVDGQPLTFFHYSGFDPRKPERLSKYDTFFVNNMPEAIQELTSAYADRLLANGHGTIPTGVYAYGRFASGTAIHSFIRQMFREWHRAWPDNPFESYEAFLHQPWPGASRAEPSRIVTNFIKFLHGLFPNLTMQLDLNNPHDVRQLVDWFVFRAPTEHRLDLRLIQPAAERMGFFQPFSHVPRALQRSKADVTVLGYLRTASGVGEAGRQTLLTLNAGGASVEGLDIALNVAAERNETSCDHLLNDNGTAPVQIFNVNADQLGAVLHHMRSNIREDALRISIPFWELSRFPSAWLNDLNAMHEIWAPSRFIQAAIAGRLDKPIIHMPVAIDVGSPAFVPRADFGLPEDRFLFFFSFDFMSFVERKNPKAVVAAFRRAFPRTGQAALVLKCMNGDKTPDKRFALQEEISGHPDIFVIDATLSRAETLGLIAASDAVISLHRSEGLGFLIAEAMAIGKPVIATDYSGSQEFLNADTGYPVDYQLAALRENEYPFAEGQMWADPDVSHAAWLMRRLISDPTEAASRVRRAADHISQNFSRARVAQIQMARLQELTV